MKKILFFACSLMFANSLLAEPDLVLSLMRDGVTPKQLQKMGFKRLHVKSVVRQKKAGDEKIKKVSLARDLMNSGVTQEQLREMGFGRKCADVAVKQKRKSDRSSRESLHEACNAGLITEAEFDTFRMHFPGYSVRQTDFARKWQSRGKELCSGRASRLRRRRHSFVSRDLSPRALSSDDSSSSDSDSSSLSVSGSVIPLGNLRRRRSRSRRRSALPRGHSWVSKPGPRRVGVITQGKRLSAVCRKSWPFVIGSRTPFSSITNNDL